ncbi:MAG TPA: hypothetical protein VN901_21980 [Candidatus Acidoferrales bacterium]|nr:hypothetical protein [Candidatus Acidoferrales bacterium]
MKKLIRKRRHNVEVVGLALLLISSAWQIFFSDPAKDMALSAQIFVLREKLDDLWTYEGAIGNKILRDEPWRGTASYGELSEHWRSLDEKGDFVEHQKRVLGQIWGIIFLIGTFLVLIARRDVLKERRERGEGLRG